MALWNKENAKHLLSRTLFGYTRRDLEKALSYKTLDDFVEKELLATTPLPPPPGNWVTEAPVANDPNQGTRYRDFTYWWYNLMLTEKLSMREKMVLFFHNHYVSQRSKVTYPQHMYIQQDLFRKNAFGNLRQLTKDVTIDPAMLIYLDGQQNNGKVANPNENYARELLELFTLGVGNYTENDIRQAAKALSGWQLSGLTSVFNAARWSSDNKTFFGKTGNYDYKQIVDIVFTQNAAATFLCGKVYEEFVFPIQNAAFVAKMAKVMRDNDYNLRPVLKFMLTADEFYASEVKGAKIKTPTQLMISTMKSFDFDTTAIKPDDWSYMYDTGRDMQQHLLEPPDVSGWKGQREWINSNTYPRRNGYTDTLLAGRSYNGRVISFKVNAITYARSFNDKIKGEVSEDAAKFIEEITDTFFLFPASSKKKDFLLQTMLDGTVVSNWSTNTPMADARILKLFKALMRSAEFQLC